MTEPLFEPVSNEEYKQATESKAKSKRAAKTDERNYTTWYALSHTHGFCTVPMHDEYQKLLTSEEQVIRQKYPTRMIFTIGDYDVCRDCYMASADLEP